MVKHIPPAFSWESQAQQYAPTGPPGIHLEQHMVTLSGEEVFNVPVDMLGPGISVIDCLLHRDDDGQLVGILNHYDGKNPLEEKDAVNVWVRPDRQRNGIATALLTEAMRRWPGVMLEKQRYTPEGVLFLRGFLHKGTPGKD